MHDAWRRPLRAMICGLAVGATTAHAGPAAGVHLAARQARTAANPSTALAEAAPAAASRPSEQISPWTNPLGYLGAAFAEIPTPWSLTAPKRPTSPPVQSPTSPKDALALEKPSAPPSPQLLISLAQMAERQGDIRQARGHYQQALSQWPGEVDVLRAAARMEDRQGHLPLAEGLYQQAVAANPKHAGALNDLGLCFARQGKLDASIQAIEGAIHLQPDRALYRNNAATVLVELRQDQKALAHLAAVHGTAEAHYNMGQLLVARGRAAEAAPYLQAALQHDPTMSAAREALAVLERGTGAPAAASGRTSSAAPQAAPDDSPLEEPELRFPATAHGPDAGTSSYVPPRYQRPSSPYPSTSIPQVGVRPRYLPPVGPPGGDAPR